MLPPGPERQERLGKGLAFPFVTLAFNSPTESFNLEDGNANSLEEVKEIYASMFSRNHRYDPQPQEKRHLLASYSSAVTEAPPSLPNAGQRKRCCAPVESPPVLERILFYLNIVTGMTFFIRKIIIFRHILFTESVKNTEKLKKKIKIHVVSLLRENQCSFQSIAFWFFF